ncbi:RyR domain-containing protein [Clostridium grantii]|uniref:RyR domain-containing protein n=1 Tax=Clostridium grantii DSM 8605 TaxID=1121316 RepID=A0A1M5XV00_9CLOT|nr:RyR domain-containing protein [Clostridium grantii]SHI03620.1 RyR domain-containing protein [Clostridium grantii DSM 8605]
MHKINYDIFSVIEKPEVITFSEKEIEILAEYEHKRWSLEKKEAGWKYGENLDEEKKIHPSLVTWDNLCSENKNKIYENVKSWPEILADSNFKIERLKFLCHCEIE